MLRIAPILFVLLWSTGWIVARAIVPYADPLTFLAARFALACLVLVVVALAAGAAWPRKPSQWGHMAVSGVFAVAFYFAGVWWAVAHGVPAGISGLIATLQPLLTALLAPLVLREQISGRQWVGIALSTVGIMLVLLPKLATIAPEQLDEVRIALIFNAIGMVAFTLASLHQKRYLPTVDLRVLTPVQLFFGTLAVLPFAYMLEPMRLEWNATTITVMAWSVIVLSICAGGLYLMMIRNGAVSRVAALIYLVPLAVAVEAYLLFGETMTPVQLGGMLVTVVGVALAVKKG